MALVAAAAPPAAEEPTEEPAYDPSRVIRVRSADDVEFEIPIAAAKLSGLLRDSLPEDIDEDSGPGIENMDPIDIARVGKNALGMVIEFLKHHCTEPFPEIPTPMQSQTFDDAVPIQWYRDFCSEERGMTPDVMSELLSAANFLAIEPLLDLMCLKFTFLLVGKNADEIRELLNLPEMTAEEEAQAREEHPWLFNEDS